MHFFIDYLVMYAFKLYIIFRPSGGPEILEVKIVYYNNPYQPSPPTSRPKHVVTGNTFGYGQYYPSYPNNYFYSDSPEPSDPTQRPTAETSGTAAATDQTAHPSGATDPVAWTNQPLARIFIRPQQYTAAASADETLRMGTAFPDLFRPYTPGGTR